jgi:ABC-type nitrate/sulfonate/bicarbonate transport system ATPase subunit
MPLASGTKFGAYEIVALLGAGGMGEVSTLLKVMVDAGTPASTKVWAADSVLDHSAKAIDQRG